MNDDYQRRFYPTEIDIPVEFRPQVIQMLNLTLVTIMDLKTLIGQFQWNQEMNFYQPHELFDELAPVLEEYTDLFATWSAALGGVATKTAYAAAKQSELPEYPLNVLIIKNQVAALADRLAPYTKLLRSRVEPIGLKQ